MRLGSPTGAVSGSSWRRAAERISRSAYPCATSHEPRLGDTSRTLPTVKPSSETPSTSGSSGVVLIRTLMPRNIQANTHLSRRRLVDASIKQAAFRRDAHALHSVRDRQTVKLVNTSVDGPTDRDRERPADFTVIARSACAIHCLRSTVKTHGVRRLEIRYGPLSDVWLHVDSALCDSSVGTSDPLDDVARPVSLSRVPMARLAPGCRRQPARPHADARAHGAAARTLLSSPLPTHRLSSRLPRASSARPSDR